jgi:hypothetical protein
VLIDIFCFVKDTGNSCNENLSHYCTAFSGLKRSQYIIYWFWTSFPTVKRCVYVTWVWAVTNISVTISRQVRTVIVKHSSSFINNRHVSLPNSTADSMNLSAYIIQSVIRFYRTHIDLLDLYWLIIYRVLQDTELYIRRPQWPRGLRPLTCWDCGFEPPGGMGVCLLWVLCVVR